MVFWVILLSIGFNGILVSKMLLFIIGLNFVGFVLVEDWFFVVEIFFFEEMFFIFLYGLSFCLSWLFFVLLELSFWFVFLGSGFWGFVICFLVEFLLILVNDVVKFLLVIDFWVVFCFLLWGLDFWKEIIYKNFLV